jgi:hypothetical protein
MDDEKIDYENDDTIAGSDCMLRVCTARLAHRARERLPRLRQSWLDWPRSAECRPGHRKPALAGAA